MTKIIFVCHGNICRSPMAEAIFRHLVEERGLSDRLQIDSAAVSDEEVGRPVDLEANAELERRGLPRSQQIARQLMAEDYDRFDYFLGMDRSNYDRMKYLFKGDPRKKVGLLMGYTDRPREIEDPWYSGRFSHVYDEIEEGCRAFLEELLRSER